MSEATPRSGGPGSRSSMVWVDGGEFTVGSADFYPDEGPPQRASVDGFGIDPFQVTNGQFAAFVEDMGYVTEAELAPDSAMYPGALVENLVPGALVFMMPPGPLNLRDVTQWWVWTPGADWRYPIGSGSSIAGLDEHPMVQVSYGDAVAYCSWAE